jgi:hypothetical protein
MTPSSTTGGGSGIMTPGTGSSSTAVGAASTGALGSGSSMDD